ncbi:MAG: alginate export family protein [Bryobacteraceae bacterium]
MRIIAVLLCSTAAWAETAAAPAAAPPPSAVDRTIASVTEERFPKWLKLSGEFRTRMEGRTGFNYQSGNNDMYGLFRTRVNIELVPASWMSVYFQGQDSRVSGMDVGRPLGIFKDTADVRQAYVRFGKTNGPVKLTVGRQLLNYGAQRVLGPLDWTNNARNWDAVKLELGTANAKVDLFASTVVQTDPLRRLNQPRRGFNIHGAYGSLKKVVPAAVFEPYLLWKTGNASIWTGGFRLASLPGAKQLRGFDYQIEIARQWGTVGALTHTGTAVALVGGRTIGSHAWKPHVSAEYSYASGDKNPGDRTHRTFDHLLGTNHLFYGLVDAVGWQNMNNVRTGFDIKPHKKLQFNADYHWLWLASARDALYNVAGAATVRPRAGNTARSIGTELDFTMMYAVSKQWKAGAGVGHLFAGEFLKQNSRGSGQTFPYVFAQYSF